MLSFQVLRIPAPTAHAGCIDCDLNVIALKNLYRHCDEKWSHKTSKLWRPAFRKRSLVPLPHGASQFDLTVWIWNFHMLGSKCLHLSGVCWCYCCVCQEKASWTLKGSGHVPQCSNLQSEGSVSSLQASILISAPSSKLIFMRRKMIFRRKQPTIRQSIPTRYISSIVRYNALEKWSLRFYLSKHFRTAPCASNEKR